MGSILRCWPMVVVSLAAVGAAGADWPQFRGPLGQGASAAKGLPTQWADDKNIAWKVDLPGAGTSSPIVVGERLFLTCYTGYGQDEESPGDIGQLRLRLLAFDRRSGAALWSREVSPAANEEEFSGFLALHGYASSTPVSDGQNVYVFFGHSGVLAFDLEGNERWRASVGSGTHGWGSASSPVLVDGLLIVNASVESGSLAALATADGRMVWRREGARRSWGTPLVAVLPSGKREIVLSMQGSLVGYGVADGGELWRVEGVDDYVCPSAVAHQDVVYAIGGRRNVALAVRAGGRGDVAETHLLWSVPKGSNVSSPVYHDGHIYFVNESRGVAYCLDAKTGETRFEERMEPRPDRIYASPVVADGKLFIVSRTNGTFVLAAEPRYKLLAHNVLAGDTSVFNASPAVEEGRIYLRSNRALYCVAAP